jgi:hypothetical protein
MQSYAGSDSVADFPSHAIAHDVKVRGRVSCLRCGARAQELSARKQSAVKALSVCPAQRLSLHRARRPNHRAQPPHRRREGAACLSH